MLKAFKYRLYPTADQVILLDKHIGCARFVYNLGLETKNEAYTRYKVTLSCFDLIKQLPDLKKECPWLTEVNSQSLQMPLRNLDNAFTNFFKGRGKFPRFKRKSNGGSFHVPQHVELDFKKGVLSIPKFRKKNILKIRLHRTFKGEIQNATISRTPTGKYFASILVETGAQVLPKKPISQPVGIDLGIKDFAILSTGEKIENPKYLRESIERLKVLSRRASKKKKGSANQKKAFKRVAVLHEKIVNQRKDFLHKLSTNIIKNHDNIAIEDLAVKNMVKNHCLAQAISDVSWSMFRTMLTYKSEWNGNNLMVIDRFAPSSKMCSACGASNKLLLLSDREWTCASCGTLHDRDINASNNIANFGFLKYNPGTERTVEPAELPTLVGAKKQEKKLPAYNQ